MKVGDIVIYGKNRDRSVILYERRDELATIISIEGDVMDPDYVIRFNSDERTHRTWYNFIDLYSEVGPW